MKQTKYTIFAISVILCISIFSSCSTKASIQITDNTEKSISCQIQPGLTLEAVLRSFTGAERGTNLYNSTVLQNSLEQYGFTVQNMTFPEGSGLNISLNAKKIDIPGTTFEDSSLTLVLNQQTMQQIIALMPEENIAYTELLMAPLITGENLTTEEYENLISSMYGKTLAAEMSKSIITVSFTAPKNILSATLNPQNSGTVKTKNKTTEFSIPLAKFLSLFSGVEFCIHWHN